VKKPKNNRSLLRAKHNKRQLLPLANWPYLQIFCALPPTEILFGQDAQGVGHISAVSGSLAIANNQPLVYPFLTLHLAKA
jgi:hypothetical protein